MKNLRQLGFSLLMVTLLIGQARPSALAQSSAHNAFPAKGLLRHASEHTLTVGGESRSFLIDASAAHSQPRPHGVPVVVLLHGGTQTAKDVWEQTSLPTLARERGFILVAPQGSSKQWNDGRGITMSGVRSTSDDVAFLRELISAVVTLHKANKDAVFMVGASNGGHMTMRFACEETKLLRAASNVISNMPVQLAKECAPAKSLPWLSMNGTEDTFQPFAGTLKAPALLSAEATFNFWAKRDVSHSSRFIALQGAGHQWANPPEAASRRFIVRLLGEPSHAMDSGLVIWDFFAKTLVKP
jgi:polyhydroxybutyrate depolymerase